MYIFGGLKDSLENTNIMHVYSFLEKTWEQIEYQSGEIPPVDSHSMVVCTEEKAIYIFGGFYNDKENGGYNSNLYKFDIEAKTWTTLDVQSEQKPKPRSGTSMCRVNGKLFIFGGTNVQRKFNDFWCFENG